MKRVNADSVQSVLDIILESLVVVCLLSCQLWWWLFQQLFHLTIQRRHRYSTWRHFVPHLLLNSITVSPAACHVDKLSWYINYSLLHTSFNLWASMRWSLSLFMRKSSKSKQRNPMTTSLRHNYYDNKLWKIILSAVEVVHLLKTW